MKLSFAINLILVAVLAPRALYVGLTFHDAFRGGFVASLALANAVAAYAAWRNGRH